MKIAGITDIHGDLTFLEKGMKYIIDSDIVLISGDITHFGVTSDAEEIISRIKNINSNVFAVSGNCDNPEIEVYLKNSGLLPQNKLIDIRGFQCRISGKGGSLPTPVKTPHTVPESEFFQFYENNAETSEIIISHQPPYNTFADKVMGTLHTGSRALRAYIDDKKPLLCLCGHIHESSGMEYYGNTLLINPGPFKEGKLAMIQINGSSRAEAEIIDLQ